MTIHSPLAQHLIPCHAISFLTAGCTIPFSTLRSASELNTRWPSAALSIGLMDEAGEEETESAADWRMDGPKWETTFLYPDVPLSHKEETGLSGQN